MNKDTEDTKQPAQSYATAASDSSPSAGSVMGLVTVAGRSCARSNSDMERACLVLLTEEQDKGDFSNSALVATLADMVRLIREYTDTMNSLNDPSSPTRAEKARGAGGKDDQ